MAGGGVTTTGGLEEGEVVGVAGGGAQSPDAVTVELAEEVADVEPTELVFVTVTVSVDPIMSASFATQYVADVAFAMLVVTPDFVAFH